VANIVIDDVVEVRINQRLANQRIMTILHYAVTAGASQDVAAWATAMHTAMQDPILGPIAMLNGAQSTDVTNLWVDYQVLRPTRRPYIRKTWSGFGALAGGALPPSVSVAITKQSSIAGKGMTGHVLYAGVPADKTIDGSLIGTYRTTEADQFAGTLPVIQTAGTQTLQPFIYRAKFCGE